MRARQVLVVCAMLFVSGCSLVGGGGESGSSELEQAERRLQPVLALRQIEIGRTRNGFSVTAFGTAPGTGFSAPQLVPRRDGRPGPDGFLDFDFVALAPDPGLNMPQGSLAAREIRADTQVVQRSIQGVRGLRVHARTNAGQVAF